MSVVSLFGDYDPHPKARKFFLDNHRFVLATCGRRGAKSHTGARRMLRKIFEDDWPRARARPYSPGAARRGTALWWDRRPRMHYWVLAETVELLAEPKRYLLQFLPAELLDHADNTKNRLWLHGDILIEFKTAHDPKRTVGSGLDGIWIEEAARIRSDAWQGFIMHGLADKGGWAQFTTTPLGEDWTFEQLVKPAIEGDAEFGFHTWRTADNIRAPEVLKYVEWARKHLPPEYFKRELEASYEAFIGQIYEHFNPDTMVVDKLPLGVQLVRRLGCQDWGFTAPGAQVVLGLTSLNPDEAHVWAIDEEYSSSKLVEEFWVPSAKRLAQAYRFNEWVADPAEPDNIDRMKRAGVRMVGHKNYQASNYDEHERSVRAGIRMFSALMYQQRFHILRKPAPTKPGCSHLISELKSYRWAQQGATLVERPAPGQKEHAATAARYGVTYGLRGSHMQPLGMAA